MTITIDRWGKDHWSTFAYLHTCLANGKALDRQRMRCDPDAHPGLMHRTSHFDVGRSTKYPTILKDGGVIVNHDDWDCLEDACASGLLQSTGTGLHPSYALTDRGWAVVRVLTEFKTHGGQFKNFELPEGV